MSYLTLYPYAQGNGAGAGASWDVIDPPTYFGGGSLSDDDDTSGVTIGAEYDVDAQRHGEPIAVWFRTPSGFDPTALLVQTRLRNNAAVAPPNPDPGGGPGASRSVDTVLSSADGTVRFDFESVSPGGGDPSPLSDILVPSITTPTWLTWWGNSGRALIDLDNPTQAGGWYQLDWSFTDQPGDKAALTGDGLRLEMGLYYIGAVGQHFNWIDLFEIRLLVAGAGGGLYPLRRWPGGIATGPTRVWPRRITRRPGTY